MENSTPKLVEIMIYTLLDATHPLVHTALPEITADSEPESRKTLLEDMVETMKHYGGIGLSANQVGLPVRMFIFGDTKNYIPCFNPRIIEKSEDKVAIEEGCLTYPGLFVKIFRSEEITVTFEDENSDLHKETFNGLASRIFQHEMDHMDGVDFRSLAGRIALDVAERKLKRGLRKLKELQKKT